MRLSRSPAIAFILAFLVCPIAGQGTPPSTAQDIDALLAEAQKLNTAGKRADAKSVLERALEGARRLALEPQQATALCGISQILLNEVQVRTAREHGLQCLEIYERLANKSGAGRAHLLIGAAAELAGDFAEARMRAQRAIDAFDAAGDRNNRGLATLNLLRTGPMEPAEAERLRARTIEDARATNDKLLEASAYHGWGDGLFASGRYEEAYDKLQHAARLYEAIGNRVALGTVFNSLGRVYRAHGQLDEALRYQLKALELHQAAGQPFELMQSLNAVAVVHGLLGHPKESREFYERALVIAERSSAPRVQDVIRANMAAALAEQGEFARSATVLQDVIAHGVDGYPSLRQAQLSYALVKLGRPADGLAAAEQAVAQCGSNATDCILALRRRAAAHTALGDPSAALADVTAALNRLEDIRKQLVPADFFKQQFYRAQEWSYSEAIALSLSQKQSGRALETAELARSRAFVDLLASRSIDVAESAGPSTGLRSMVNAPPARMADITTTAARLGSTFLLYWVAEDGVFTWVVTPDGGVRAHRVPVLRSKLDELVRATAPTLEPVNGPAASSSKPTIATRGAQTVTLDRVEASPWRELYDLLIQPVRDALPRTRGSLLTIVPHGSLLNLSFAALQDKAGRYFVEDYTIQYTPAASMLQLTSARTHAAGRAGDALIVADPSMPALSRLERPLPRLPGARSEAGAIAALLPRQRVTVLRDALATKPTVRAAAAGKTVLHFATHAIVRDDDPFKSFLALGPGSGEGDDDGLLTAEQIYHWKLDADLVVLSACRSGSGRITGDGVATFVRAFIYAGAPSVVVSLWDVADEPTNRLLPAFYRVWLGGQSKARSLRSAQLQLLADLRAGKVQLQTPAGLVTLPEHPVFWAGFALIGEPD